jgi:hypothetical protein
MRINEETGGDDVSPSLNGDRLPEGMYKIDLRLLHVNADVKSTDQDIKNDLVLVLHPLLSCDRTGISDSAHNFPCCMCSIRELAPTTVSHWYFPLNNEDLGAASPTECHAVLCAIRVTKHDQQGIGW